MSIFVIGMNHKTAPLSIREKVYFPLDKVSLYLQDLINRGCAQEAVLLSTCNRSEVYCNTEESKPVWQWFCSQTTMSAEAIADAVYIYRDEEAVSHIIKVACGLDSMILGEPQILGQMKEAFSESCAASGISTMFHRLFQLVFKVAKEIRTTTSIGACPVSVASAAVHFAKQTIADFANANVLLMGAGDTSELLLRYLTPHLNQPLLVVNRDVAKARSLLNANGKAYSFDQLTNVLEQADLVFSATGSPNAIIDKNILSEVMAARADRPLTFIDIAVPRDIDPDVTTLEKVALYCIDDLKTIIAHNRQGREHAAEKAREMIRDYSNAFILQNESLDSVTKTIRAYRGQIEEMCHAEVVKAKAQLARGLDPHEVLDTFVQALIKKLLHAPSVQLRQAGAQGQLEFLKFANQLFAITDLENNDYETIHAN